jgi:hypothetical protein
MCPEQSISITDSQGRPHAQHPVATPAFTCRPSPMAHAPHPCTPQALNPADPADQPSRPSRPPRALSGTAYTSNTRAAGSSRWRGSTSSSRVLLRWAFGVQAARSSRGLLLSRAAHSRLRVRELRPLASGSGPPASSTSGYLCLGGGLKGRGMCQRMRCMRGQQHGQETTTHGNGVDGMYVHTRGSPGYSRAKCWVRWAGTLVAISVVTSCQVIGTLQQRCNEVLAKARAALRWRHGMRGVTA